MTEQQTTPMPPEEAKERIASIDTDELYRQAKCKLRSYCHTTEPSVVDMVDVVLLGSVLRGDFVSGESDIDFLYVVTDSTSLSKNIRDYLWQWINSTGTVQRELDRTIGFDVDYIDCNGVVCQNNLSDRVRDEIVYSLHQDQVFQTTGYATEFSSQLRLECFL